jgi:hypothetical protein
VICWWVIEHEMRVDIKGVVHFRIEYAVFVDGFRVRNEGAYFNEIEDYYPWIEASLHLYNNKVRGQC